MSRLSTSSSKQKEGVDARDEPAHDDAKIYGSHVADKLTPGRASD
jgi:hypothetical protein